MQKSGNFRMGSRLEMTRTKTHCPTRHLNLQGDSGIFTNMNIILTWLKGLEIDPSGKSTWAINNSMSRIWMDLILDGRRALDIFCLQVVLLSKVYLNWSRLATYLTVIMSRINSSCTQDASKCWIVILPYSLISLLSKSFLHLIRYIDFLNRGHFQAI